MIVWTLQAIEERGKWFSEDKRDVAEVVQAQRSAGLICQSYPCSKSCGNRSSRFSFCGLHGPSLFTRRRIDEAYHGGHSAILRGLLSEDGLLALQPCTESSWLSTPV